MSTDLSRQSKLRLATAAAIEAVGYVILGVYFNVGV